MTEEPSRNPSALSSEEREKRMWEKIHGGEAVESIDDMSDEYYVKLCALMLLQADSELAAAFCRIPWITRAPVMEERLAAADMVRDELRHARAVYRLAADLGIDTRAHIEMRERLSVGETVDDAIARSEGGEEAGPGIFSCPIETWTDFVMFQFCFDRGERHQLEDIRRSTYGPWKREIDRIIKEEMAHEYHGDFWVRKMAFDRPARAGVQEALNKWYPRTMNMFGKPEPEENIALRKFGLKYRNEDEVRMSYTRELRVKCSECGLKLPVWKPEWEKVEEDGVMSGV